GDYTSLAVDGSGRVHVSYSDGTNVDLKYATCAASCTTAANWQTVVVDQTGFVGAYTSLAVDGSGRVHVSYQGDADPQYPTRAAAGAGPALPSSAHVTTVHLTCAPCADSFAPAPTWHTVAGARPGFVGAYTSLAGHGSRRLHVSYQGHADLKYATCPAGCTVA